MTLPPGTRLGPYEIQTPIGAGGMGEVYRARDPRLDRIVAIKILPEVLAGDAQLRDRFEREARALSALDHPHICAIYDVGELQGRAYLVMQYLEGETLADRLLRGPLPVEQALLFAIQIADALDKAHRAGIVHRDLKPGNVMLTKTGAKLLDFGLAKSGQPVIGGTGLTMAPTTPAGLTMQGAILGTLQYMAPEQVEGKDSDPRTDIFAFGAVLYEMLTGRKAFEGKSSASLIGAILKDEPAPPSTLAPLTPPALDHVVVRCLNKDPDRRWQTATDLLGELHWLAAVPASRGIHGVPLPLRTPQWVVWTLAGVAALATAAAGVLALRQPTAEGVAASVRFSLSPPQALVFGIGGGQSVPSVSPDGKQVVFVTTNEDGRAALWVRPLDVAEPRLLEGTQGASFPFWSPDSLEVAFFADGQLKVVGLSGGPARAVCDAAGSRGGSWGSGGTLVYSTLQGGLFSVPAMGGAPATVTLGNADAVKGTPLFPTFLPDGERFLYFDAASNAVWLGSLGGAMPRRVVTADSQAAYVAPGSIVYAQQGTLFLQPFDVDVGAATDSARPLAEQVTMDSTGAAAFSVSRDALVYRTGTFGATSELRWVDRDGRLLSTIGSRGRYRNPALSPDDTRVAVEAIAPGARTYDVWVIDLTRGVSSRLTFDPADDTVPRWSPDGRRILFRSNREGAPGLYAKSADGAGAETQVTGVVPGMTSWGETPDGSGIIVTLASEPGPGVAVLPLAGGAPDVLDRTPLTRVLPAVSADGRWLLYNSIESGRWEVYVQSFRAGSGRWQISTEGGVRPRWGRTGREVYYMAPEGRLMAVPLSGAASLTVGNPEFLFQPRTLLDESAAQGFFQQYDVARDGRFLLNVPLEPVGTAINVVVNWADRLVP